MSSSFSHLSYALRIGLCVVLGLAGLLVLLGPFHAMESWTLGADKLQHVLLFYVLSLVVMIGAPRAPLTPQIWMLLFLAAGSEVLQGYVGRETSLHDFSADALGMLLAFAPRWIGRPTAIA